MRAFCSNLNHLERFPVGSARYLRSWHCLAASILDAARPGGCDAWMIRRCSIKVHIEGFLQEFTISLTVSCRPRTKLRKFGLPYSSPDFAGCPRTMLHVTFEGNCCLCIVSCCGSSVCKTNGLAMCAANALVAMDPGTTSESPE